MQNIYDEPENQSDSFSEPIYDEIVEVENEESRVEDVETSNILLRSQQMFITSIYNFQSKYIDEKYLELYCNFKKLMGKVLCLELPFVILWITLMIFYFTSYVNSVIPLLLYTGALTLLITNRFLGKNRFMKPAYTILLYLSTFFMCKYSTIEINLLYYESYCLIYLYVSLVVNFMVSILKFLVVSRESHWIFNLLKFIYFCYIIALFFFVNVPKVGCVSINFIYLIFLISPYKIQEGLLLERAFEWIYFWVMNWSLGLIIACLEVAYISKIWAFYDGCREH